MLTVPPYAICTCVCECVYIETNRNIYFRTKWIVPVPRDFWRLIYFHPMRNGGYRTNSETNRTEKKNNHRTLFSINVTRDLIIYGHVDKMIKKVYFLFLFLFFVLAYKYVSSVNLIESFARINWRVLCTCFRRELDGEF